MGKLMPYLLVFALLLQIANAETLLYSGKVITDSDKEIDKGVFRFRYDETANKVFVQTPSTNLIVDNGACKSNAVFRVCINRANFSYKNVTTYVFYYEVDTTIYKLVGGLSAPGKAAKTTLFQNEQTEFTITITNPTDFDVTQIIYVQDMSPFYVKESKGCSLDQGKLSWQGSLKSRYDKICSAVISAAKEGTFSMAGNLSYFNSYETEKKATDALQIKVLPKQLVISKRMDNVTEVRQPFFVNMSVQNINKDEKIEADASIELPGSIVLLREIPGFGKDSNILRRRIILEPGTIFNYSLYLQASKEGAIPIKQAFDYAISNVRDVLQNETLVNAAEPQLIVNFTSDYSLSAPSQKFIAYAKLKNPSRFHELRNIKARLKASYNHEITQSLDRLMPNESTFIISNTLILPGQELTGDAAMQLNLSIEYSFYEVARSLNAFLELGASKSPNETVIAEANETAIAETKNETGAGEKNESQSQEISEKPAEIIEDAPPAISFKAYLSDKKLWVVITAIFVTIFAVPIIMYLKKLKKQPPVQPNPLQPQKNSQQNRNLIGK